MIGDIGRSLKLILKAREINWDLVDTIPLPERAVTRTQGMT